MHARTALLFLLTALTLTLSIAQAYTITEVDSNPYVGVRQVPGQDVVVYPNNSSIVYANAERILKTIDISTLYYNQSVTYTATENEPPSSNVTTQVSTIDGNYANTDIDGALGYSFSLALNQPLVTNSYILITFISEETTTKTIYARLANSTVLGSVTAQPNSAGIQNLRIDLNAYAVGQTQLYLGDMAEAGDFDIMIDYIGVYNPNPSTPAQVQAACDRDNVVKWGGFGSPLAGEELDLYFYCNPLKEIHHYDYSTGTLIRTPYDKVNIAFPPANTLCLFQEVHAVTEDWYVMSCYEQDSDVRLYTLKKNNLSIWNTAATFGGTTPQPGTIAPAFGYTNVEGSTFTSEPLYIEDFPNTFYQSVGWKFGSANYMRSNLMQISPTGAGTRYYYYNYQQAPTNDTSTLTWYARNLPDGIGPGGYSYAQSEGRGWCELIGNTVSCNNGAPTDYSPTYANNAVIDFNQGGLVYTLSDALLPNGTIIPIRAATTQGFNKAYISEDLDVTLVSKDSVLLDKGGVDLFKSYGLYYAFIDGAFYYMPTSGSLYKLTGLPSGDTPPTLELLGRYQDYPDEACLAEGVYAFVDNYNDTVITQQDENCTFIGSDQYGEPYITISDESSVRTVYEETSFLAKAYDVTQDELHIAYNCFSRQQDIDIIDTSDWEDYNEATYTPAPACPGWTKGTYESALQARIEESSRLALDAGLIQTDVSACAGELTRIVTSNGATTVTYAEEFLMDQETGVKVELHNIAGELIASFIIEEDFIGSPEESYSRENRFYIAGTDALQDYVPGDEPGLVYSRKNNDDVYDRYTHRVELLLKGTELSYSYSIGSQVAASGTVSMDANELPPVYKVVYHPRQIGAYAGDHVQLGQSALIRGQINPAYDVGVEELTSDDQYRYYRFSCDYSDKPDGLYYLRVYANDEDTYDYSYYIERVIQKDTNYIEYLSQVEDGVLKDEEAEAAREAGAKEFTCTTFSACDDTSRLFIALLIMLVATFGAAAFMRNNYEPTFLAQVVPAAVFVVLFIAFASIGFLPTWFIISCVVLMVGAGAVVLNPVLWMRGGGGGRY